MNTTATSRSAFPGPSQSHNQPQPGGNGSVDPAATNNNVKAGAGDSYFVDAKKGEVNELRTLLRTFSLEKTLTRKREIIKKVIAYMTLGIDVSRLLPDMLLVIETRDLVIKKMVYLYLCTYASTSEEVAIMCINTLMKDCSNDDPMVRGLALRSLTSLRLKSVVEYVMEPLRKSLDDANAYVRKTAVLGVLKLHDLSHPVTTFLPRLTELLDDSDPAVVSNCISVLNELNADTGGMEVTRDVMLKLLNRLGTFNEFGLAEVLNLLCRYTPTDKNETFQIMNLLDPVLRTSNSGSVLAVIKSFLHLTNTMEELRPMVYERVKPPILTLIAGGGPEQIYVLLKHVKYLCEANPGMFDNEYRQLYVRYNEPTSIKYLKLSILPKLASADTAVDIITELCEYVSENDIRMAKLAIEAIAKVATERACQGTTAGGIGEIVTGKLVELCSLDGGPVSSAAACALKDVLRAHPNSRFSVAPVLGRCLKLGGEEKGKASLVWMIGEFGDIVIEAPYVLEKLVDSWDENEELVKLSLLTACVKLFFKRPPEMQAILGRLLTHATNDVSSQDLHDRALLYYRLLKAGPEKAEKVVNGGEQVIEPSKGFAEDDEEATIKALREEFNTLSIVYGSKSAHFIGEQYRLGSANPVAEITDAFANTSVAPIQPDVTAAPTQPTPEPPQSNDDAYADLLGFADSPPTPPSASVPAAAPQTSAMNLNKSFAIDGGKFQGMWQSLPEASSSMSAMSKNYTVGEIDGLLTGVGILTMASGEMDAEFKFFLYAQDVDTGSVYLLQLVIDKMCEPRVCSLSIKTDTGGEGAEVVAKMLGGVLGNAGM
ncbi:hypothetical protein TL16_g02114 [Triparma laevis f. inornata]|uniref:AP complex subunit beta n=1 Tax=Triparma laevis f. inornata TaxID=1714386 RepID=A0A9W6ZUU5_9STRA|nr:hypothetical protein TL16_g02114 [Triparma laevis f. inornata]